MERGEGGYGEVDSSFKVEGGARAGTGATAEAAMVWKAFRGESGIKEAEVVDEADRMSGETRKMLMGEEGCFKKTACFGVLLPGGTYSISDPRYKFE